MSNLTENAQVLVDFFQEGTDALRNFNTLLIDAAYARFTNGYFT